MILAISARFHPRTKGDYLRGCVPSGLPPSHRHCLRQPNVAPLASRVLQGRGKRRSRPPPRPVPHNRLIKVSEARLVARPVDRCARLGRAAPAGLDTQRDKAFTRAAALVDFCKGQRRCNPPTTNSTPTRWGDRDSSSSPSWALTARSRPARMTSPFALCSRCTVCICGARRGSLGTRCRGFTCNWGRRTGGGRDSPPQCAAHRP